MTDPVYAPHIEDPDAPGDSGIMTKAEADAAAAALADLFPDLITASFAPWSDDPDSPEDSLIMTKAECDAAANNLALMFPDLVRVFTRPQLLLAFQEAIDILDETEVEVRDVIERRLANKAGYTGKVKDMDGLANRLAAKVSAIRADAFKLAFRTLRTKIGYVEIKGHSLSAWAHTLADNEAGRIRTAIKSGLMSGLDNTEIAAQVIGSMMLNGTDGVTAQTRYHVSLLARVHTAHMA